MRWSHHKYTVDTIRIEFINMVYMSVNTCIRYMCTYQHSFEKNDWRVYTFSDELATDPISTKK